jgi:hypothetical protein
MQFVCASMKLRQIFYTQIELRTFHTVWTHNRHGRGLVCGFNLVEGLPSQPRCGMNIARWKFNRIGLATRHTSTVWEIFMAIALVTGTSSGIGQATAVTLARGGILSLRRCEIRRLQGNFRKL